MKQKWIHRNREQIDGCQGEGAWVMNELGGRS